MTKNQTRPHSQDNASYLDSRQCSRPRDNQWAWASSNRSELMHEADCVPTSSCKLGRVQGGKPASTWAHEYMHNTWPSSRQLQSAQHTHGRRTSRRRRTHPSCLQNKLLDCSWLGMSRTHRQQAACAPLAAAPFEKHHQVQPWAHGPSNQIALRQPAGILGTGRPWLATRGARSPPCLAPRLTSLPPRCISSKLGSPEAHRWSTFFFSAASK